jgi:hypothetical protein
VPRERIAITRPARPFWLQGGETDGHRWDAFEAIRGAPIALAVQREDSSGRLTWENGRLLLLELSEELDSAAEDGTLPSQLCLDQVWVEPNGRIKLLDAPLRTMANTSNPDPGMDTPEPVAGAVQVLRETTALCSRDAARAVHVQDFIDELQRRPEIASTLTWAAQTLREVSHRRCTLKWDDRLGVLAASMGTEQSFYILYGLLVAVGCAMITTIPLPLRVALAMSLAISLPALLGFWLRGGPVFRVTGTKVRNGNRPASRMRCGWRGFVAWAPAMIAWSLLGMVQTVGANPELREDGSMSSDSAEMLFYLVVSAGWSLPYLVFLLGALCTLIRPSRGVQDLLAGTSLVPR